MRADAESARSKSAISPARRVSRRASPIHGYGVFALRSIAKGERVMEYRGERISDAQALKRYGDNSPTGHTFLFSLNDDYLIDGNVGGNVSRWINHSCEPNCEAVIYVDVDGDTRRDRVMIEALRDIRAGEELTYDYAIELDAESAREFERAWRCRCGTHRCRGSLLAKPPPRRRRPTAD
jgi:SET domain-containing protein